MCVCVNLCVCVPVRIFMFMYACDILQACMHVCMYYFSGSMFYVRRWGEGGEVCAFVCVCVCMCVSLFVYMSVCICL